MSEQLELFSASGLPLKPFYTAAGRAAVHEDRIGDPGRFPFTRGHWLMQQVLGAGEAEQTREMMDRLVAEGMEGYLGHPVFNVVFAT